MSTLSAARAVVHLSDAALSAVESRRRVVAWLVGSGAFIAAVVTGCQTTGSMHKTFTPAEVKEVQALVADLDPATYRLVLPTFRGTEVVGSQTYGHLPVTEIRRVASAKGIAYAEDGNLQAVFQSCSGGGAGSHVESKTPGSDLGNRIDTILKNLDKTSYVFVR